MDSTDDDSVESTPSAVEDGTSGPQDEQSELVHNQLESPNSSLEEDAYWAEVDHDDSVPDDAELEEISSAKEEFDARDYPHWERSFFRELDDPEYRPIEKARLTWKIKGVRGTKSQPNRAKLMRSPAAYIGGYWWIIKFFPRGNNVGSLSVYIECTRTMPDPDKELPETEFRVLRCAPDAILSDSTTTMDIKFPRSSSQLSSPGEYRSRVGAAGESLENLGASSDRRRAWRVSAQIGVTLYNPDEPRTVCVQSSCHQFSSHNPDWGWTNFHGPWDQIQIRQRGQRQALLRNDTLAFDAYIRIFEDPTQSLWWHRSDSEPTWDSLALTGYRPLGDSLVNHSADVAGLASWLNIAPIAELIQSVDAFRHLSNCDIKPRPLCDALQKCLWLLRRRDESDGSLQYVDTDGITSVLRNLHETSTDVTEFWERLRRTLELELVGTDATKQFADLFDSPFFDATAADAAVNTLPTDFISRICVAADEAKSIQSALDERLGEKPGRWSLPAILNIELSRQKFDKKTRQWRMIYGRVELDEYLDLSSKVVHGAEGRYVLYGYIVHRGRRTSGKFFSILRPGGPGTKWLAFDDGSDNRVECLTKKTAFNTHLGLKLSEKPNESTGHDVPVNVMYIRSDVVHEYLPGPQGPWTVSDALKTYYENGTYPYPKMADGMRDHGIHVEVYSFEDYDQLSSIFDAYDLMSLCKAANNVMYLTLPPTFNLVNLRNQIATWKSTGTQQIRPDRIRLWQIDRSGGQIGMGPAVALERVSDLEQSLVNFDLPTVRFWMQILSESDAEYFSIADPLSAVVSGNKSGGTVIERERSLTPDERPMIPHSVATTQAESVHTVDGQDSTRSREPAELLETFSSPASEMGPVPRSDGAESNDSTSHNLDFRVETGVVTEAALGATSLNGTQPELEAEATEQAIQSSRSVQIVEEVLTTTEVDRDLEPARMLAALGRILEPRREIRHPVRHVCYFIQIFDIEKQELRTVGSFFSQVENDIKSEISKHLQWPKGKDFVVWQPITSMCAAGETFEATTADGACFVVGDKLSKQRQAELRAAGLFTNPDELARYLLARSRNHPTEAFTGTKTIDATFAGDYYSGEFLKGYYHGSGTHISSSAATYTGEFIFGQRHGKGMMEYPSGDIYDGNWVYDQRHGWGTFIDGKTGNKYVGGYKNGKRHGKGVTYWEVADEEMDLCEICYGEEKDALFYDCGHVCACIACARQVDICPICRKNVINVVKIYRT